MAIGDIYRVLVAFSNAGTGEDMSFALHGEQDLIVAPDIAAIGDDVKAWWNTDLGSGVAGHRIYVNTGISLERVTLRRMVPLEPVELIYTTGLPIAGASTGEMCPPQTSPLMSIRTGKIGRSYRGRAYLPPTTETFAAANGVLSATDAENMVEQFDGLLQSLNVDSFRVGVFSRKLQTLERYTSVVVDRVQRTQRRRADESAVYVAP